MARSAFTGGFFSEAVKPGDSISWPALPFRGIIKTAWDAKLILMADLASPVSCASLGHLLMIEHCHLCLNVCFSPPTTTQLPPPPTPIDSIHDIIAV